MKRSPNIQAYFDEDTDWPESCYASGVPDENGMLLAMMTKQYRQLAALRNP